MNSFLAFLFGIALFVIISLIIYCNILRRQFRRCEDTDVHIIVEAAEEKK